MSLPLSMSSQDGSWEKEKNKGLDYNLIATFFLSGEWISL